MWKISKTSLKFLDRNIVLLISSYNQSMHIYVKPIDIKSLLSEKRLIKCIQIIRNMINKLFFTQN